jgi:hypothetical protein
MFGAEVTALARQGHRSAAFQRGEVAALALQTAVAAERGGEQRLAAVPGRPRDLDSRDDPAAVPRDRRRRARGRSLRPSSAAPLVSRLTGQFGLNARPAAIGAASRAVTRLSPRRARIGILEEAHHEVLDLFGLDRFGAGPIALARDGPGLQRRRWPPTPPAARRRRRPRPR